MRIVFVCNALRIGGSQSVIRELIGAAVEAGYEPVVASRGGELAGDFSARARTVSLLLREGPSSARSGIASAARTTVSLVGVAQLRSLLTASRTLVQASQPWPVAASALAVTGARTPLVWHAHGTTSVEMPPPFLHLVRRSTSAWVGITPEVEHALRVLLPAAHTAVMTLPSPLSLPCDRGEVARPVVGVVGVMSTLTANKLEYVRSCIEAARLVASDGDRILLRIVGDGPERERISREASAVAAATRTLDVELNGASRDPWPILADAEVVIGMGLVALEAAVRGHNVICASSDGIGGILAPNTYRALYATNFTGRGLRPLLAASLASDVRTARQRGVEPMLQPFISSVHGVGARLAWRRLWSTLEP